MKRLYKCPNCDYKFFENEKEGWTTHAVCPKCGEFVQKI